MIKTTGNQGIITANPFGMYHLISGPGIDRILSHSMYSRRITLFSENEEYKGQFVQILNKCLFILIASFIQ